MDSGTLSLRLLYVRKGQTKGKTAVEGCPKPQTAGRVQTWQTAQRQRGVGLPDHLLAAWEPSPGSDQPPRAGKARDAANPSQADSLRPHAGSSGAHVHWVSHAKAQATAEEETRPHVGCLQTLDHMLDIAIGGV